MPTYSELLANRSNNGVAHYWNPQPMSYTPFNLFSDEDLPCQPEWGVDKTIQKLLALGLFLELPVGQWVMEARKKELANLSPVAQELLKTNIKDEASHERGFRYAADVYPIDPIITIEAENIFETWMSNESHPLEKAGIAETGVFLCGLGIMRLAGGASLCEMAEKIAVDESRHVSTNRGILTDLGYNPTNPSSKLRSLVKDTLSWLCDGFSIPGDEIGESFAFDAAFLMNASDTLIETGEAKVFDSVMDFGCHTLPFEVSNAKVYSRNVYD